MRLRFNPQIQSISAATDRGLGSIERVEDAALLSGRGRFIDDLGLQPGTLHATILRSPHAHADILSIEIEAAKRLPAWPRS